MIKISEAVQLDTGAVTHLIATAMGCCESVQCSDTTCHVLLANA